MTCRSENWQMPRSPLQSSAKEFRHSLTEPDQPTAEWTTRRRLANQSPLRGLVGRLRSNQMLHLLVALSSIHHLHAIPASIGSIEVSVLTILFVRVRCDMVAMRKARTDL